MEMMRVMVAAYPPWLLAWIGWLGLVNGASVLFLRHDAGKRVLLAFVGAMIVMQVVFWTTGFTRLLGLGHVLCWTPLLPYLWRERARVAGALKTWVTTVLATDAVSLVVDYVDVARYLLGERG